MKKQGFTLIELLIVVAIIAILAAIAIPNFLQAQTRSKVSRTRADMRSIAVGLESYYVDQNAYPLCGSLMQIPDTITTPVAYLSSIGKDPFGNSAPYDLYNFTGSGWKTTEDYWYATKYYYDKNLWGWYVFPNGQTTGNPSEWVLQSKGPDHAWAQASTPGVLEVDMPYVWAYDPTNGTVSRGNIVISGP